MLENDLLAFLEQNNAVLTGRHFVFTSGNHGPAYINMRAIAHKTPEAAQIGRTMGILLFEQYPRHKLDIIIGPETLGRTLAPHACEFTTTGSAIWCEMEGEGDDKRSRPVPETVRQDEHVTTEQRDYDTGTAAEPPQERTGPQDVSAPAARELALDGAVDATP